MDTLKQAGGAIVSGRSTVPIKLSIFTSFAEQCLIPSLILSAVISNQLTWPLGPIIGQALGWAAIFCASVIVLSTFRGKLWPLILIVLVFMAKGYQIVFSAPGEGAGFSYYIIIYGCLLCSAGATMIACRLNLVYKQIYIICLLNVVFMFMQVAGIADWSQFAATHFDDDMVTYPIAFFNETAMFDTTQRRPSGLLYSNQYLSIIALFGLAVHFSRKRGGFATATFVVCAMAVLSMAKLVFLGFMLMGLIVVMTGTAYQRLAILKGFALTILLICIYAILFPGLFESNLNVDQLIYSFSTRISSILYEYGADDALIIFQDIANVAQHEGVNVKLLNIYPEYEDRITGYIELIRILPFVSAIVFIILPLYLWGLIKLRAWFPELTTLTVMCMIIVVITPAAGPLWGAPLYLFICGFALFPIFILIHKQYLTSFERGKVFTA